MTQFVQTSQFLAKSKVRSWLKNNFFPSSPIFTSICRCSGHMCEIVPCCCTRFRVHRSRVCRNECVHGVNKYRQWIWLMNAPQFQFLYASLSRLVEADEAISLAQTVNSATLHHRHLNTLKLIPHKLLSFITRTALAPQRLQLISPASTCLSGFGVIFVNALCLSWNDLANVGIETKSLMAAKMVKGW